MASAKQNQDDRSQEFQFPPVENFPPGRYPFNPGAEVIPANEEMRRAMDASAVVDNKPSNPAVVEQIVDDMLNGAWILPPEDSKADV